MFCCIILSCQRQTCLVSAVGTGASFVGAIVPIMIFVTVLFFTKMPCFVQKKMIKDIYTASERERALCHLATHLLLVQISIWQHSTVQYIFSSLLLFHHYIVYSFLPSFLLFCSTLLFSCSIMSAWVYGCSLPPTVTYWLFSHLIFSSHTKYLPSSTLSVCMSVCLSVCLCD